MIWLSKILLPVMVFILGSPSCTSSSDFSNGANQTSMKLKFVKEIFTDTLYLSDFATSYHLEAKQKVVELPTALSFDRCEFRGPVFASRRGERLMGTSISFSESSFASSLDMSATNLSQSLDLFGVLIARDLKIDDCYIGNRLELRSANVKGGLRITEGYIGDLQGARMVVRKGTTLQRTTLVRGFSLMEAELYGYVDFSYINCFGNAFLDLLKNDDRLVLDHAHFHQRLSMANTEWPNSSLRSTIISVE